MRQFLAVVLSVVLVAQPLHAEGTMSPAAAGHEPWLAFNLNGISDWSPAVPFIDHMKSARPWIGHRPGEWDGWSHEDLADGGYLDENGWPLRLPDGATGISTLVLTDLPADTGAVAGRYRITHDGDGLLEVSGRVANMIRGRGRQAGTITFDFTPGDGTVLLTITRTDPANPVRNIQVVKERHIEALEAGEIFNPDWLARIDGARALRFMDWGDTNDSELGLWEDRPRPDDYTWARIGVPPEVMIRLANETGADPWFTLPHLADDDFIRRYAETVRDGLDPELTAYIELSNEVWNWQFRQARWADEAAMDRWGHEHQWQQYYAVRAAEMVMIWDEVFAGQHDRLVRVIATQPGWIGLEEQLLAPLWQAEDPANPPPPDLFDAYAITGYFTAALGQDSKVDTVHDWIEGSRAQVEADAEAAGLEGEEHAAYVSAHRFDHAVDLAAAELRDGAVTGDGADTLDWVINVQFAHHAEVAQSWGLDLIMYEGGTHVVGIGPHVDDETLTEFFTHLNYTPQMGELYQILLDGWYRAGGDMFNAFVEVAPPSRWGSWGALRHLTDHNPRWEALVTFDPASSTP